MAPLRAAMFILAGLLAAFPAQAADFRGGGVTVRSAGGVSGGGFHGRAHGPRFAAPRSFHHAPVRIGPPNLSPQARPSSRVLTAPGAVVIAPEHRIGLGRPAVVRPSQAIVVPRPGLVPPSRIVVVQPRPVPVFVTAPRRPVLIVDTDGFFLRVGGN